MATIVDIPYKCTFIHIPKTAGNSVTDWLKEHANAKVTKRKQHATVAEVIEGDHGLGPINDLGWKFCIVRNPWDYMVSWYTFKVMLADMYVDMLTTNTDLQKKHKLKYNLELQKNEQKRLAQGFDWWVKQTRRKPQSHWAKDCDYVMKLENINNDFLTVQKKLNCFEPLPHKNKTTGRTNYKDYYTSELIDIVAEKYKVDIDKFNYTFD